MHGAEQPKKRCLFPIDRDDADRWQLVRQDWNTYQQAFQGLPPEVNHLIAYFLLRLKNSQSFSTSPDQFFRRLLNCCVTLSCKEKKWKFPLENLMHKTCDGKYYIIWEDGIKIHDARTSNRIQFLPYEKGGDYQFLPERNVILRRGCDYPGVLTHYYLYDIVHNTCIDFGQWFESHISPTKKYIWGFDKKLIHIWNIADLNNIKHHTLEHNDQKNHFLRFSSDDTYIIMGTRHGSIVFLKEEDSVLKECFSYSCSEQPISGMECVHHEENDYLILYGKDQNRSIGMKIETSEEGIITLKKSFDVPQEISSLVGKNGLAFWDPNTNVCDYSGKLCSEQEKQKVTSSCVTLGKYHSCYQVREDSFDNRALIMTYPECDDGNNFKGLQRIRIDDVDDSPYSISSNFQGTLWWAELPTWRRSYCLDLHGKKILSFDYFFKGGMKFHSNGRSLMYQNYEHGQMKKGEIKKKYVLHPKGADAHLNKLAHSSLTVSEYFALEKLCEKAEEVRNKNPLLKAEKKTRTIS